MMAMIGARRDVGLRVDRHRLQMVPNVPIQVNQEAKFSMTTRDEDSLLTYEERVHRNEDGADDTDRYSNVANNTVFSKTLHKDPEGGLRVFMERPLPLDVFSGFDPALFEPYDRQFVTITLEYLAQDNRLAKISPDFGSYRGLLTNIGTAPYDVDTELYNTLYSSVDVDNKFDKGHMIAVQKVNGVYYMTEFPTQASLDDELNQNERNDALTYGGLMFERHLTARPGSKPTPYERPLYTEGFGIMASTTIGSHSLFYEASMDSYHERLECYVELKTSTFLEGQSYREWPMHRHKHIRWWMQASLGGVPRIFCGLRDKDGLIQRTRGYATRDLPQEMAQDRAHHKPSVCLAFLDKFLAFVKSEVTQELEIYLIIRDPHTPDYRVSVDTSGEHTFLPSWYLRYAIGTG